jgi:hypothetical protein
LGNDQAGLNRLSQTNLVCENATTFAKTSKCKDHRVNLVGVRINARLPLRSRIALTVVWPADPDEVFGKDTLIECVETHVLCEFTFALASQKL